MPESIPGSTPEPGLGSTPRSGPEPGPDSGSTPPAGSNTGGPSRGPRLARLRRAARPGRSQPRRAARRVLPARSRRSLEARRAEETEASDAPVASGAVAGSGRPDHPSDLRTDHSPGRLRTLLLRPGRGQVIAAVFLFVVGLGAVVQVRLSNADDAYANARREDLIQILDGLGAESRRLENEVAELERTKSDLQSGADRQQVARTQTERRLNQLAILAGTAPAVGPGVRMTISDPKSLVTGEVLLDAVEEMRDAGAEVIEINDSVRVVASSWFGTRNSEVVVDDRVLTRPITLEVIGDSHSLEEAASFRGGLVSEITGPRIGGQVSIQRIQRLEIVSLHTAPDTQYARPASPPPTPR